MIKESKNVSLKPMNSFGIEVRCASLIEFCGGEELKELFVRGSVGAGRWTVLSGGSNILFTRDFEGVLLHPISRNIDILSEDLESIRVRVGAGVEWDDFVEWCVERGYWGAENLSYIPGYVGASPVQNIGAYGVEAKDIIESVEMFCTDSLSMLTLSREHCGFGYRNSVFKGSLKGKVIITDVIFILNKKEGPNMGYGDLHDKVNELGGPTLRNIRDAVTAIRRSKLPEPSEIGNAGSFFKNPVVRDDVANALKDEYPSMPLYPGGKTGYSKLAAGWLIDQCGWKGRREGNVGVHERQALVIVNHGGATGQQVLDLATHIQTDVKKRFGIEIDMEVNIL